jgi:hypothetical protein
MLFVFSPGFFFFDEIGDKPRHAAAADATRRLWFSPVRVSHMPEIKRLLCTDVVIVVKGKLPTFTALKILGHGFSLRSPTQAFSFGFAVKGAELAAYGALYFT